jgi:hypothetical protein
MNGKTSMKIVQPALPPPERSCRRNTSITARTQRMRKRTTTAPMMIRTAQP